MTRPVRRRGRLGTIALAGWLFADFLLVLALVAMGDQADPLANRHPQPRPTAVHSPTPSPTPTGPRSVSKRRFEFHVSGTDDSSLIRQIKKATKARTGQEAAFVLTFGGTRDGTEYARRINKLLHRAQPRMFGRNTATEDFLNLTAEADTARLWVYYYTSPS
ncbi:hypothetical protein [Streptomyces sp. NPDC001348]